MSRRKLVAARLLFSSLLACTNRTRANAGGTAGTKSERRSAHLARLQEIRLQLARDTLDPPLRALLEETSTTAHSFNTATRESNLPHETWFTAGEPLLGRVRDFCAVVPKSNRADVLVAAVVEDVLRVFLYNPSTRLADATHPGEWQFLEEISLPEPVETVALDCELVRQQEVLLTAVGTTMTGSVDASLWRQASTVRLYREQTFTRANVTTGLQSGITLLEGEHAVPQCATSAYGRSEFDVPAIIGGDRAAGVPQLRSAVQWVALRKNYVAHLDASGRLHLAFGARDGTVAVSYRAVAACDGQSLSLWGSDSKLIFASANRAGVRDLTEPNFFLDAMGRENGESEPNNATNGMWQEKENHNTRSRGAAQLHCALHEQVSGTVAHLATSSNNSFSEHVFVATSRQQVLLLDLTSCVVRWHLPPGVLRRADRIAWLSADHWTAGGPVFLSMFLASGDLLVYDVAQHQGVGFSKGVLPCSWLRGGTIDASAAVQKLQKILPHFAEGTSVTRRRLHGFFLHLKGSEPSDAPTVALRYMTVEQHPGGIFDYATPQRSGDHVDLVREFVGLLETVPHWAVGVAIFLAVLYRNLRWLHKVRMPDEESAEMLAEKIRRVRESGFVRHVRALT
ncbi:unnamed protein product [Amoebophrya sp. A120]|nr:unnamed protein product [Amoebophrya sp. A120]|eukprot:GSA120T00015361001.1